MHPRYLVFLSLTLLTLCSCATRRSLDTPMRLTPVQIADRAKPATVAIVATFEATGTIANLNLDTRRLGTALEAKRSFLDSKQDTLEKAFGIFLADPAEYLREESRRDIKVTLHALGSGFIVTPDGYLLTNAHVVDPDKDDLKKAVVDSIVTQVNKDAQSIEDAVESTFPGKAIDEEAMTRLKVALAQTYARSADLNYTTDVSAAMPSPLSASEREAQLRHCEIEKVGTPTPGKDVAILKIEGTDLPTLPLAPTIEEADLRTGSDLVIIGYPGKVALETAFTLRSRLQPSLTTGHVSGVKDMSDGWRVIQTDAAINPGNSGGPVFNEEGQVVGLATYSLVNSQSLNFAIAIDVAHQFLDQLNVKPRESSFTRHYRQALLEYDEPGHGQSLTMFRELSESHPDSAVLNDFVRQLSHQKQESGASELSPRLQSTHADASGSTDSSGAPGSFPTFLLVGVGGILGAILLVVIILNRR